MENRLDILTKKLYEEGVEKAKVDAEDIIKSAKAEADRILKSADHQYQSRLDAANNEANALRKRVDSELILSARQAKAAIKESITDILTESLSKRLSKRVIEDKEILFTVLVEVIKRWDIKDGKLDVELLAGDNLKLEFDQYISENHKKLLDQGLKIMVGGSDDRVTIQPTGGGYQLLFSEELFDNFFKQYIKGFTKSILFKESPKIS